MDVLTDGSGRIKVKLPWDRSVDLPSGEQAHQLSSTHVLVGLRALPDAGVVVARVPRNERSDLNDSFAVLSADDLTPRSVTGDGLVLHEARAELTEWLGR